MIERFIRTGERKDSLLFESNQMVGVPVTYHTI